MAEQRPIRRPAADFDKRPLPVKTVKGLNAMRVHGNRHPATGFRLIPSHRFSHPDAPEGLLYAGFDLGTCLWEVFGDAILDPGSVISSARWMKQRVSRVHSSAIFRLCDLTDQKTRTALKVDLSALKHTDLDVPQAWGLAIQKHPDNVDGFLYQSRFSGETCIVLFDRPGLAAKLNSTVVGDLADLDEGNQFLDDNEVALV